eukprot:COSAG01_NODE_14139_length_1492_cov_1.050251_1_plen_136_part_00
MFDCTHGPEAAQHWVDAERSALIQSVSSGEEVCGRQGVLGQPYPMWRIYKACPPSPAPVMTLDEVEAAAAAEAKESPEEGARRRDTELTAARRRCAQHKAEGEALFDSRAVAPHLAFPLIQSLLRTALATPPPDL